MGTLAQVSPTPTPRAARLQPRAAVHSATDSAVCEPVSSSLFGGRMSEV